MKSLRKEVRTVRRSTKKNMIPTVNIEAWARGRMHHVTVRGLNIEFGEKVKHITSYLTTKNITLLHLSKMSTYQKFYKILNEKEKEIFSSVTGKFKSRRMQLYTERSKENHVLYKGIFLGK